MGEGLKIIEEFVGGIEKVWERVLGIESDSVFTQGPENSVSFVFITMVHSTQGLGLGAGGHDTGGPIHQKFGNPLRGS